MKTLADYAVPTRANTQLPEWWGKLNAELTAQGLAEVTYGTARDLYECGYCPKTAAAELEATR